MNGLTDDFIAIDTSVFGHLTNKKENPCGHINKLLVALIKDKIVLLVDTGKEISSEYTRHLTPEKLKTQQKKDEAQLIKYWMRFAPRKKIDVDKDSQLWKAIYGIITEKGKGEEVDRVFVYVAFNEGRILISDDKKHIVNRRKKLKSCCVGTSAPAGADVMSSEDAHKIL